MSQWMLEQLLEGIVENTSDFADVTVDAITLDSRAVEPGSLFVALKGAAKHGLEYAESAIANGAVAMLWESDESWTQGRYSIPSIEVEGLREKLGLIADRFYHSPSKSMNVIGVTGTDGKSTVSHFVADALNACGQKSAVIGTLGVGVPGELVETGLTTPDVITVHHTIAALKEQGVTNVIMEVSSHALDQSRVAGVHFDVAALSNLGRDHLDYHETVEAYAAAKAKLFEHDGLKAMVLNMDDEFGRELIGRHSEKTGKLVSYGVADPDSITAECLTATNPQYLSAGIQADFHFQGETATVNAGVLGEFNLYNLLAATACMMGLGMAFAEAASCVQKVKTVPGRMEKVSGDDDALVVVDYAHTPDALEAALKAIRVHTPSRLVCVFGCGGDRDRGKRPLMAKVAEKFADMVVLTDDNPRSEMPFQIMHEMINGLENPEHVAMEHDRAKAIRFAVGSVIYGDSILIAGKGHERYQLVRDEKLPFDDREQAREALKELAS